MRAPATLERDGIAARIPHRGAMCLLERLHEWSADHVVCSVHAAGDPDHPLRLADELPAACALEYASQAMALHGALCSDGADVKPGFLASARELHLHVPRLDDAAAPMRLRATRLAGDGGQAIYRFELHDAAGRLLVDGRATVVLNQPLASPAA